MSFLREALKNSWFLGIVQKIETPLPPPQLGIGGSPKGAGGASAPPGGRDEV